VLGGGVAALDADASERWTAQVTRPQKAVGARDGPTGLCSMTNAPEPLMTMSPAAAHGARYRVRHVGRGNWRPLSGGSVALGGSLAPFDGPVDILPLPWTARYYQD